MTRLEIVTAALALVNEPTGDYITAAFLNARYNEAKRRIERRTLCYPVTSTFTLTASVAAFILPAGLFALRQSKGVYITGFGFPTFRAWDDLVGEFPLTWNTTEATYPNFFYLTPAAVTTSGVTNWGIGFYPLASATITDGVTLYGHGISADAAADGTPPPWPTPHHMTLVWELCVMAATMDMDYQMRNARTVAYFKAELKQAEDELRAASDEFSAMGGTLQIGGGAPGQPEEGVLMNVNVTL
ncbi:MAG TPA: hypothetical protein VMY39_03320 [Planctomycetota bacterium]|nr:hypothetical protein [Planctomycetota bacterium]